MIENKTNKSEYYHFGKNVFGPFLYGFVRWLYKNILEKKYVKVFFFSRDGYMMEKAFNCLNDADIDTEYVYFSRNSIRQALLWRESDYKGTLRYLTWERYYSIGKVLEYFGFTDKERDLIAEKKQIDLTDDISSKDLQDSLILNDIYDENRELINERSMKQDKLLLKYLQQIKMQGACAIVDIGWHGSMQYYLEMFLDQHYIDASLDGYYVGILPNVPIKGACYGYVYNPENSKRRKQLLCFFGGYEKLFQSKEGSTAGYKETKTGNVVPVLGQYEYDPDIDAAVLGAIEEWQLGAIDYVENAKENLFLEDDDSLTLPLIRFGRKPTMKNVKLLSFLYNNEGSKAYYTAQKRLKEYSVRELLHDLSNSPWKTGFMKSVFKVPFPYYVIYEALRK